MAHLTLAQRYTIACMHKKGYKQKDISEAINKDKSVVSRELKRNCDLRNNAYRSSLAQQKYTKRQKGKPRKRYFTSEISEGDALPTPKVPGTPLEDPFPKGMPLAWERSTGLPGRMPFQRPTPKGSPWERTLQRSPLDLRRILRIGMAKAYIDDKLHKKFSPEQIVGTAKKNSVAMVSCQRIYQYIWEDKKQVQWTPPQRSIPLRSEGILPGSPVDLPHAKGLLWRMPLAWDLLGKNQLYYHY